MLTTHEHLYIARYLEQSVAPSQKKGGAGKQIQFAQSRFANVSQSEPRVQAPPLLQEGNTAS
jgi:hypothetical protein